MTFIRSTRSPAGRSPAGAAVLGLLLAAAALQGGCLIVVSADSSGDRDDFASENLGPNDSTYRPIGVSTARIGSALAAQTGLDPTRSTLITRVYPGSAAEQAGLQTNDIITAIDGRESASSRSLREAVSASHGAGTLHLTVLRAGKSNTVDVRPPGQLPAIRDADTN